MPMGFGNVFHILTNWDNYKDAIYKTNLQLDFAAGHGSAMTISAQVLFCSFYPHQRTFCFHLF